MVDGIGIGISTYNRPDRLAQALESVFKNFSPENHPELQVYLYDDGSDVEKLAEQAAVVQPYAKNLAYLTGTENRGVGYAKNRLLEAMMVDQKRWLFLMEDDQIVTSSKACGLYIDAYRSNKKIHHLMFAHHGPANRGMKGRRLGPRIEFYPNCIGSWCFYTFMCIREVGLMDEHFRNAFEHVEHTHRIQKAGMLGLPRDQWGWFPDAVGSRDYVKEQAGSLEDSQIRTDSDWDNHMKESLLYWRQKDPADFPLDGLLARWGIAV